MERTERDTPERFCMRSLIMGELMQTCGAEVFRVEDTLARMGKAYGVERMNVFVITSSCDHNGIKRWKRTDPDPQGQESGR